MSCRDQIIKAVKRVVDQHDAPNTVGLQELEIEYGGPACGAAGVEIRKWPEAGIVSDGFRIKMIKQGRRRRIHVERVDGSGWNHGDAA